MKDILAHACSHEEMIADASELRGKEIAFTEIPLDALEGACLLCSEDKRINATAGLSRNT